MFMGNRRINCEKLMKSVPRVKYEMVKIWTEFYQDNMSKQQIEFWESVRISGDQISSSVFPIKVNHEENRNLSHSSGVLIEE
ncbi:hypothetical protein TNCV_790791 [Trichonephila clavipes]|nr:hypothetical protein TNCV_790791 [Trichonephila clavipes]